MACYYVRKSFIEFAEFDRDDGDSAALEVRSCPAAIEDYADVECGAEQEVPVDNAWGDFIENGVRATVYRTIKDFHYGRKFLLVGVGPKGYTLSSKGSRLMMAGPRRPRP